LLDGTNFNNNPGPGLPANVEFDFDSLTPPTGMTYTVTDLATNQVIPVTQRVGTQDGGNAAVFLDLPKSAPDGDYFATMQDAPDHTLLSADFFIFAGDFNMDSQIDSADFNSVADHFNSSGANHSDGDMNRDGVVNALDYNAVSSGYGDTQGFTPRFTVKCSDDPESFFDIGLPVQYEFTRTTSDESQDLNIYWSYEPNPDNDTAIPGQDFEAPDLAPGFQNDIYVFSIPAGQQSATLTLEPLDNFRADNLKVIDILRGQNSGPQAVPLKAVVGKVPVQTQIWISYTDKPDQHLGDSSSAGLAAALAAANPHEITNIEIIGHASENSIDLDKNGFLVGVGGANPQILDENNVDLTPAFQRALAIDADVKLQGCKTGVAPNTKAEQDNGVGSIAQIFSKALPGRFVYGYRGTVKYFRFTRQLGYGKKRIFHNGELILQDPAPPLFASLFGDKPVAA
jgi:hypothetical protein